MSAIQQALLGYGAVTDSSFSSVVALLHFDDVDASTTFTDVKGHSFTAGGNAQIDTAQSKFGGSSLLCDGTGDWITTVDSADFTLGTNNFTIEFWVRFNAVGATQQYLCGQTNSSLSATLTSVVIKKDAADKITGFACVSGASFGLGLTTAVTTGQWYHVAFVRNGTAFTIFLDGVGTAGSTTSSSLNDSANNFSIGRAGEKTTETLNGWIDDFRFTNGIARYTSNFTPPIAAFPNS